MEIYSDHESDSDIESSSPFDTPEAQIQRHFLTFDSSALADQTGANAREIYGKWQELKRDCAGVKEREVYRHHRLAGAKRFVDEVCEAIFASLSTTINNTKSLSAHFTALSNNLKEFARKMLEVPEVLESEANTEEPMGKLFGALAECDKNLGKEAFDFAGYIEAEIISELQEGIKGHNSRTQAYKNEYPKLFANVENTEKKVMDLFKSYMDIVDNNEIHILTGKFFDIEDSWILFNQYTLAIGQQKTNVCKYSDFCESLIELRKDLETVRIALCNKGIEKACKGYETYFGKQQIFDSILSFVLYRNKC
eukprot:TRINITY_DN5158_c0_g1_i2.p1 TRINITY_DN5158_c0_g1~~TRINITY_DN5158_c0_g1_i2.p1  ORF type:complete len:329 (-),score=87.50 TRINITY_DN5158_c0_g1_i2:576-1502(-)